MAENLHHLEEKERDVQVFDYSTIAEQHPHVFGLLTGINALRGILEQEFKYLLELIDRGTISAIPEKVNEGVVRIIVEVLLVMENDNIKDHQKLSKNLVELRTNGLGLKHLLEDLEEILDHERRLIFVHEIAEDLQAIHQ